MSEATFLSDAEVADICAPLVQPAAQIRYLKHLGLPVLQKPNGRPLVSRTIIDKVLLGISAGNSEGPDKKTTPDFAALSQMFNRRKKGT